MTTKASYVISPTGVNWMGSVCGLIPKLTMLRVHCEP